MQAALESLREISGTQAARIEVADLELAEELAWLQQDRDCTVSCRGDLPLLTEPIRSMQRELIDGEPYEAATRVPGVTIEHLRAFADAAQEFRLAAPWRHLESIDIIEVGAPRPSPNVRFACVLGAHDQFGIGFAEDRSLLDRPPDEQHGGFERLADTSLWSVTYCEAWEIPILEHEAWQRHELAADPEGRIPSAVQFGPKQRVRRASPKMLAFFEGCFRALASTTEDELDRGERRKVVDTSQGPLELNLPLPDILSPPERAADEPLHLDGLRRADILDSISRLLEEQDFASMEEMQAFLDREVLGRELPPPKIDGPRDEARELALEALESPGPQRRRARPPGPRAGPGLRSRPPRARRPRVRRSHRHREISQRGIGGRAHARPGALRRRGRLILGHQCDQAPHGSPQGPCRLPLGERAVPRGCRALNRTVVPEP